MFKVFVSFVLAFAMSFSITAAQAKAKSKKVPVLVLTANNTVVLRGVVTYDSVKLVQKKLLELSSTLPKRANIIMVLDTPGGSIGAGMELIQVAKAIPQKVVTLTNFAASMGFITAQSLGRRLILPHGVLMSHRAWARISGQVPGELNTRLTSTMRTVRDLEEMSAARMKIPLKKYVNMIRNEYWTHGRFAVVDKSADRVVRATCDHTLLGTNKEKVDTIFGPVEVNWSKCPLISSPIDTSYANIEYDNSIEEIRELKHFINSMYSKDKKKFIEVYMNTGKYKEFLK